MGAKRVDLKRGSAQGHRFQRPAEIEGMSWLATAREHEMMQRKRREH